MSNSLRGIRKRGLNYYINFQKDGKRTEVCAGPNLREAQQLRKQVKTNTFQESFSSSFQKEESITYRQAVEEHKEQHLKYKKSYRTMLAYFKELVILFGDRPIHTLTWKEIEDFKNKRLLELSASFVRKELIMMGAVLERQVKMGTITENPIKKVQMPKVSDTRNRIITHDEFLRILNAQWDVDNRGFISQKGVAPHLRLALIIADYTGMRIGEILNTKWIDVDIERGHIFIPDSKNGEKRFVPIHPELTKILKAEKRYCEYVIQHRGRKICFHIRKGFINALEAAGIDNLRIHDFRHRAITRWVQEGQPTSVIMAATGHKTFSSFKRYANLRDNDIQRLVGRKTNPIPVVTFKEYTTLGVKNVAKRGKPSEPQSR
ncbi:MAG: site-specific integrase [Fibrobacteres bacterium]|nr:site-specific integrase [Fibrobacterota bacterium]